MKSSMSNRFPMNAHICSCSTARSLLTWCEKKRSRQRAKTQNTHKHIQTASVHKTAKTTNWKISLQLNGPNRPRIRQSPSLLVVQDAWRSARVQIVTASGATPSRIYITASGRQVFCSLGLGEKVSVCECMCVYVPFIETTQINSNVTGSHVEP